MIYSLLQKIFFDDNANVISFFCCSETSSICSSDPGLFTNDEGRQGTSAFIFSSIYIIL